MRNPVTAVGAVVICIALAGCSHSTIGIPLQQLSTNRTDSSSSSNPVVLENMNPGSSLWQLPWAHHKTSDDVNLQIKGYTGAESVAPGGKLQLMVTVNPAQSYTVDIFRLGDYQGLGGRHMEQLGPFTGAQQPPCSVDVTTRMNYCTWSPSVTLAIPSTWLSGVYVAVLTNASNFQSLIPFWVVDRRKADILCISSLNTYEAYNDFPRDGSIGGLPQTGHSLYIFNSAGKMPSVKVSFDRPFSSRYPDGDGGLYRFEPELIGFLEHSGYDVTYANEAVIDANPSLLLQYRAVVLGGHAEYQSMNTYNALIAARDNSVGLAFLSSDEIYWQIRYEPNAANKPYRVIVGYKNTAPDPVSDPSLRTIQWRQLGRPEQQLIGVEFPTGGLDAPDAAIQPWTPQNTNYWTFAGTGLVAGRSVNAQLVGYEIDSYDPKVGLVPATCYSLLSASPIAGARKTLTQNSSIYQSLAGNWVWGAGTMAWSWGLYPGTSSDDSGNNGNNVQPSIQNFTSNVLNEMIGVSHGKPPSCLVPTPTPSSTPTPGPTPAPSPT